MSLARIEVDAFRNLRKVDLTLDSRLNFIWGANASGKTSLLEAIHLLARGRGYTKARPDDLIQRGRDAFRLGAGIRIAKGEAWLGMERSLRQTRVRFDGCAVSSLSEIAWLLPVHVINTESQRLFTEGPQERRSVLDWGVFHVEHGYRIPWRRYQRALRQRNRAIRLGDQYLARAWEPDMIAAAESVDASRRHYLQALLPYWQEFVKQWLPHQDLHWSLRSGWLANCTPHETLERTRAQEMERGHTLYGPHRADLRFLLGDVTASAHLSRSQQKLVVIALRLAQARLAAIRGPQRPLILIDDLAAELDAERREYVMSALPRLDAQLLVTMLARDELVLPGVIARMFHVEQGRYREVI